MHTYKPTQTHKHWKVFSNKIPFIGKSPAKFYTTVGNIFSSDKGYINCYRYRVIFHIISGMIPYRSLTIELNR